MHTRHSDKHPYRSTIITSLVLLTLVCLMLFGCSKDTAPLPEVLPLPLDQQQLKQLYGMGTPYSQWYDSGEQLLSAEERELNYRWLVPVTPPEAATTLPLLVFSHGNWSSQLDYEPLLQHWVQQGYLVLSVNHLDCCSMAKGIFNALRFGNLTLIEQRAKDIGLLLDNLDTIRPHNAELAQWDGEHLAITGHSFGAFTAQMFAGAQALNTDSNAYQGAEQLALHPWLDKVDAVVAISPPGPMFDEITEHSWDQINKPMLVTTGTWDVEPRFFPQYQLHQMSYAKSPASDQYSLLLSGADHYFGHLICRPKREVNAQDTQFELLLSASTAFLDRYLKQDQAALAYLAPDYLTQLTDGFARLDQKP